MRRGGVEKFKRKKVEGGERRLSGREKRNWEGEEREWMNNRVGLSELWDAARC